MLSFVKCLFKSGLFKKLSCLSLVDLLCRLKIFIDNVKLYSKKFRSIYIPIEIYEGASFATHSPMLDIIKLFNVCQYGKGQMVFHYYSIFNFLKLWDDSYMHIYIQKCVCVCL